MHVLPTLVGFAGKSRLSWHLDRDLPGDRIGDEKSVANSSHNKIVYWCWKDGQGGEARAAAGVPKEGVQYDLPAGFLEGWTKQYDEPYSHHTTPACGEIVVGVRVCLGIAQTELGLVCC